IACGNDELAALGGRTAILRQLLQSARGYARGHGNPDLRVAPRGYGRSDAADRDTGNSGAARRAGRGTLSPETIVARSRFLVEWRRRCGRSRVAVVGNLLIAERFDREWVAGCADIGADAIAIDLADRRRRIRVRAIRIVIS